MRNAFASEVTRIAQEDPRFVVLSGDIGNRLFDKLKAAAPNQFYNCGVAEANMISLAAGMASAGLRPVCYTITPFITYRCYEQIRIDVSYHKMPVIIVGTGSGLSYSALGSTHHSCEDLAVMRVLPDMQVFAPADEKEVRATLRAALKSGNPSYIRIGKKGEPVIHKEVPDLKPGQWLKLKGGEKIILLSTGNMLSTALEASELLSQKGLSAEVWSCPSVKPLDTGALAHITTKHPIIATLEEHSVVGGFGSAIGEWLTAQSKSQSVRLINFGTEDKFLHDAGEQEHAREISGLSTSHIVETLLAATKS